MSMEVSQQGSTIGAMAKAGVIGTGVAAGVNLGATAVTAKALNSLSSADKDIFISGLKKIATKTGAKEAIAAMPDGFLKNHYTKLLNKGKLTSKSAKASANFWVETMNKGKIAWSKFPKAAMLKSSLVIGGIAAAVTGLVCLLKKD